jgi:nitrite reductase/ring-hydroxylating ferredoxin subunit
MADRKIIESSKIEENKVKIVSLKHDDIGVFKRDGIFYAYIDNCSHTDEPMGELCLEEGKIVCPLHDAVFDAVSGKVMAPPAVIGLEMLDVVEKDGFLYIDYDG